MSDELLIILGLVLANGLFSGAEIAVITMRDTRVRQLLEEDSGAARALAKLRGHPERFLATVQVGITVVSATAAAFGGARVAQNLAPLLAKVPLLQNSAEEIALALVVGAVSYLSLVIGELVPKSLALRAAEPYALLISRPLVWLSTIARPLVWFLTASSNVVLRLFGDRTSFVEGRVSIDELVKLVEEAGDQGDVHPHASSIASRALAFGTLTAADVMIPRPQVVALSHDATPEQVREIVVGTGHSRLPVYEGSLDECIGYVSVRDLLPALFEHRPLDAAGIRREAWFVPETVRAAELLAQMQQRRTQIALVVDESGGLAGIVTLEDLVEELVGEIFSETQAPELPWFTEGGHVVARGIAPVRDLNRALNLKLPEEGDWTSIGGLCIAMAEHIPMTGDRIALEDGTVLEIADASPRRIRLVRIRLPQSASSAP